MGMFSFVTNRTVANKAGKEDAGRVKAFVKTGGTTLEGDMTCPECGQSCKINQVFKRPLAVKCSSCGETVKLARLKDEIKKDRKKGA
jgi:uncharacterized protein (DUF983 family)